MNATLTPAISLSPGSMSLDKGKPATATPQPIPTVAQPKPAPPTQFAPGTPATHPDDCLHTDCEFYNSPTCPHGGMKRRWYQRVPVGDFWRIALVGVCALAIVLGATWPLPVLPLVGAVGLVVGLWPIAKAAAVDIKNRFMSSELSMLIAIIAAAAIGQWGTALVVTIFVLAAEILEDLAMQRGRGALAELLAFLPETVTVRLEGKDSTYTTQELPLDQVKKGQILLVAPGEKVAVDATVVAGASTVDASRITGESLPAEVREGDQVWAGSINLTGALQVRVENVGQDSSYGQIIQAVREASESAAPVQSLADRLAAWIMYIACAAAVVTFLITRDFETAITVIVVAGACGIAAGTPLAVLAAIGRASQVGAFVKDGASLEALSAVNTVVFDKTGTLTTGQLAVIGTRVTHPDTDLVWSAAASVEAASEHPVARAIVNGANERGYSPSQITDFHYEVGVGVSGRWNGHHVELRTAAPENRSAFLSEAPATTSPHAPTSPHVCVTANPTATDDALYTHIELLWDGDLAAVFTVADQARREAKEALARLRRMGMQILVLTGDSPQAAQALGGALGLEKKNIHAALLPADKMRILDELKAQGRRVAMVGDGVNDAPALARANVGIAMGAGTQVAQAAADVVLITSNLTDFVRSLGVARQARRVVMCNFVGTLVVDAVGMVLAAYGLIGPLVAAAIHVGSESAFILNSARLLLGKKRR